MNRCSVPDFDCNTIKMNSKATVWGNIWNGILRAQKSSLTTKYGTLGIRIIFHLTMLSLFIPSICQILWYLMKLIWSEYVLKLRFHDIFLEYKCTISVTNRNKIFIQQYVRAFDVFNQMKRSRFLSVSLTLDHQMRLNVRTFSWPQACLKIWIGSIWNKGRCFYCNFFVIF